MQDSDHQASTIRRTLEMFALIVAGEAIFFLPFVLPRVFRPTLLDVFGLTNLELGIAFSIYGVVAMLAYFPGGPLADRFSARNLMVFALLVTSVGGVAMLWIPALPTLKVLYGFWGISTILLFWAPLIRATRTWGGAQMPGRAFGILDGGRGLVAAGIGSGAVMLYSALMPADIDQASADQRTSAFRLVIVLFIAITIVAAVLVAIFVGRNQQSEERQDALEKRETPFRPGGLGRIIRLPTVWLQAIVVVCAYVCFKGLDDVSLYAHEVLGMDEVRAAGTSTISMWVRPFAALAAGFMADRFGVTRLTIISLVIAGLGSVVFATGLLRPGMLPLFFATLVCTSAAVFALRGLYFAMMEPGNVPLGDTGTAVGIVSFVGYTPDVFMGPLMGYLLDAYPGSAGHQLVFGVLAMAAVVGLFAAGLFWQLTKLRRGSA